MEFIRQIHKLALEAYGEANTSPLSLYQKLYNQHPESFIICQKENKILGYIIICYLNDHDFSKTITKDFKESQLDFTKQIEKTQNIYFFSIIVDKDSPKNTILSLLKQFKEFLKESRIKNVSALIYSSNGARLAKLLKMDQINPGIFVKNIA